MAKRRTQIVPDDANRQKAWRAVREFKKLIVGLNAYARAVTGNPAVRVFVTEGESRTDGTKIYIRPPIALGDNTRHERQVCNKRGENKRMLCEACDAHDLAMASVFHEIAHIVFGSRVKPNREGLGALKDLIYEYHPVGVCDHAPIVMVNWDAAASYLDNAAPFSPGLAIMINALEDARVNAAQFKARPGTRVTMEANLHEIFESGAYGDGSKKDKWQDRSVNAQILIGLFLEASGYYEVTKTLHPGAQKILRDPGMSALLSQISGAPDAHALVVESVKVFRMLAKLGVIEGEPCQPPPPPEPEPEPPLPEPKQEEPAEPEEPDKSDDKDDEDDKDDKPDEPDQPDESDGTGESDDSNSEQDPDGGGEFGQSDSGTAEPPEQSDGQQDDTGTGEPGDSTPGSGDGDTGQTDQQKDMDSQPSPDDAPEADKADGDPSGGENPQEGSGGGEDAPRGGGDLDHEGDGNSTGSESGDADENGTGSTADDGDLEDGSSQGPSPEDAAPSDTPKGANPDEEAPAVPGAGAGVDDVPTGPDSDSDEEAEPAGDGDDGTSGDMEGGEGSSEERSPESPGEDDGSPGSGDRDAGSEAEDKQADQGDGDSEPGGSDEDPRGEESDDGYSPTEQDGLTHHEGDEVPDAPEDDVEDRQPLTLEDLQELLTEINLHHILKGEKRDEFATGHSEISEGGTLGIDPNHLDTIEEAIADIAIAVLQSGFFDTSSKEVGTVKTVQYGDSGPGHAWSRRFEPDDFKPIEGHIARSTLEGRVAFDANARGRRMGNLKAGKVDTRNLAKRVPQNDPRMFKKNINPKRRDYLVVIGADISGSTRSDDVISRIKRAVYGQAEMLHRLGIPFVIYAHSAGWDFEEFRKLGGEMNNMMMDLWIYEVKGENQPWNAEAKQRLADLRPQSGNLDGHTLEFYRKVAEKSSATDAVICYYTDGAMPASNYHEELEILQREIKHCRTKGIALLAVGIDTDSPVEHGFDTVQVNEDADLPKVVQQLRKQLTG